MNESKKIVQLSLLGQPFSLKTDKSAIEITKAGALLDEKLQLLMKAAPQLSLEKVAMLTALNLLIELEARNTELNEFKSKLCQELSFLEEEIEQFSLLES